MALDHFECTVIGGGIVGLAIAKELSASKNTVLLESSNNIMSETSSRNSEVVHSGIYYPFNSKKRQACIEGKKRIYEYCKTKNIPHKKIGKLIISNDDMPDQLHKLYLNGKKNGIDDLIFLEEKEISKYQNNIKAKYAIFSPSSGIIDTHLFGESLKNDIEQNKGLVLLKTGFEKSLIKNNKIHVLITNPDGSKFKFSTNILINCSGHSALEVEKNIYEGNETSAFTPYPVKGNYFSYSGKNPFKHLIYPIPDKLGLGIHSTSNMANELKFGPDVDLDSDGLAVNEDKKEFFYNKIKDWWPEIIKDKLQPDYAGIRPKIKKNGTLLKDFVIKSKLKNEVMHISMLGIESPGITSSLSLAKTCADLVHSKNPEL